MPPIIPVVVCNMLALQPKGAPQNNFEQEFQKVKELVIEDNKYDEAIPRLLELHKQSPKNPEILAYLAAICKLKGDSANAEKFKVLLDNWINKHPNNPKGIIAQMFYYYKSLKSYNAVELSEKTQKDPRLMAKFSNKEKKIFYLLTAEAYNDLIVVDDKKALELLQKGINYAQMAYDVKLPNKNDEQKFLDYRCEYIKGCTYIAMSLYLFGGEKKECLNNALDAFGKALDINPKSQRVCADWKDLKRKGEVETSPPLKCIESFPKD